VFCSVACKRKVYDQVAEMAKLQLEQAANAAVQAFKAMAVKDQGQFL
jgi:CRISPR/Cas system type I-B associated protein Csh2 (Cas7 group RAMP superfamily)